MLLENTFEPRPHASRYFSIRNFLNPLSRVEIFKYAMNPESWGIVRILKPDIFYPVTSQDRAQFLTVNIQDGAERNGIDFLFLGLQFQVL